MLLCRFYQILVGPVSTVSFYPIKHSDKSAVDQSWYHDPLALHCAAEFSRMISMLITHHFLVVGARMIFSWTKNMGRSFTGGEAGKVGFSHGQQAPKGVEGAHREDCEQTRIR